MACRVGNFRTWESKINFIKTSIPCKFNDCEYVNKYALSFPWQMLYSLKAHFVWKLVKRLDKNWSRRHRLGASRIIDSGTNFFSEVEVMKLDELLNSWLYFDLNSMEYYWNPVMQCQVLQYRWLYIYILWCTW